MDTKRAFEIVWAALHGYAESAFATDDDGNFAEEYREEWDEICEAMAYIEENHNG